MKLKLWHRVDGWQDKELPITANFRGLRILKGSVNISPEELERHMNVMDYRQIQETLRNIRYATVPLDWRLNE